MTRVLYLDCLSGISGDMLLGALVDVGLSVDEMRAELAKLQLEGYRVESTKTRRAGLAATQVTVSLEESKQPHRRLADILTLIDQSSLPASDKERGSAVFQSLAEAEASVHGSSPDDVEFHEVGAVDAIVDVMGIIAGLRLLAVEQLCCSAHPGGAGWVATPHGQLPVPAPATLALLTKAGAAIKVGPDPETELVTPTGAAIVATLARFERPAMSLRSVGYGAGGRDPEDRPNVLRVWLGETTRPQSTMLLIETNIDDMSPELLGYAHERLFETGAVDVWMTPVQMKKGRPGVLLSVLCPVDQEQAVVDVLLSETSTLGVRVSGVSRHEAERESFEFESSLGPAAVKVKRLPGRDPVVAPEYEACARIARERGLPLADVYRIMQAEALEHIASSQ